jgi:hypothetical protein
VKSGVCLEHYVDLGLKLSDLDTPVGQLKAQTLGHQSLKEQWIWSHRSNGWRCLLGHVSGRWLLAVAAYQYPFGIAGVTSVHEYKYVSFPHRWTYPWPPHPLGTHQPLPTR